MKSKNALLPYSTNSSGPVITLPDTLTFTSERTKIASDHFSTRLKELQEQYNSLLEEAELTELVYSARYTFVPVIGQTYHLYGSAPNHFLSRIAPDEWKQPLYQCSVLFTSDSTWKKIDIG